ncbi:sulfite reductase [NADPH] flavoprotein component [Yamadazyma tenuis]|uniref:assimilatory sulfite reductase (NADPH) n=1 Tax=Candida tenuis (strain ATCC 10573 / BCRC 21748 / CBS 615 / JCM 9827 / NBRC 10315 / NRRL Y-1498 / VKM Y-70) TaxID=590646 RepID=G3B5A9_CANTC|nr:uncharacterized protein CANTEDRAFT_93944 [Yamadazyma tenuis ATCC 10573]EGV63170.1 hypothetical protein CANTEDRAFT_93944 [Yamadazyma tenuis ATCC 10573]WEJ97004.1 sulfite reductase [NADPH] flavoprotein component [Yamadazyma tenuis]
MAPHALAQLSGANSPSASTAASISDVAPSAIASAIKWNPFDTSVDPGLIKGSVYTSAVTVVNQAIFGLSNRIFTSDSVDDSYAFDGHLHAWINGFHRVNPSGQTPFLHKFETRSGAGRAVLGFINESTGPSRDPVSVLTDAAGLAYMVPALSGRQKPTPVAFAVAAAAFNQSTDALVPCYEKPLAAARLLNYPVFTPTDVYNGLEHQHLAILAKYLSKETGRPSVFLFDGVDGAKGFTKHEGLLSVDEVHAVYHQLESGHVTSTGSPESVVSEAFDRLSAATGLKYAPFEYVGHARPETVFVVHGSGECTKIGNVIERLAATTKVGVVKVRVPLPFSFNDFIATVPKSTAKLVVLSSSSGAAVSLKGDISMALFVNGVYNRFDIDEYTYSPDFVWTPITTTKVLHEFVADLDPDSALTTDVERFSQPLTANSSPNGSFLVWGSDNGEFASSAAKLAFALSLDDSKTVSFRSKFDNARAGGLFQAQIVSAGSTAAINEVDAADVALVDDPAVLKEYDVLATLRPEGTLLLGNRKKYDEEELVKKLPADFKRSLASNKSQLVVIDFSSLDELTELKDSTKGFSNEFLIQYAFWSVALPELNGFIVNKLLQANGGGFELLGAVLDSFINTVKEKGLLKSIKVEESWVDLETDEEEVLQLPFFPAETSFTINPRNDSEIPEETVQSGYVDLAKKLAFREAYDTKKDLRPDLPVKNFVVKVQENIRLTPDEYSRNIFHIEFDVSGTGLTYDIGEALGIHGRNHPEDVEEFIEFYGLEGDSLIEITNKDDSSVLEIRSVRQSLAETLDFLGKPPKRFYESLAEFATDDKEKEALTKLASSEGAVDLKKRQEVDFCTYWDILEEFQSCRPPFAELVKIIAPLKRREYSIASSQRIHPNAVHLLIVVVDWTDSKGRKRWGHCSKYLSDLSIGDELVVSVKPSVMKLPPLSKQPIVMSGLGTGLAPFKAFIEEKIWQQQQGMEIGDIFLFMGSRHKKEEYLYGELWEAYKDAGILTHIGAAFSRDQPEKIYIQDKIRDKIEDLTNAMVDKNGSFYLCGPTWPVPDITACLEDVMKNAAAKKGEEIKDLTKLIEDLKEEGRYVLEVY